MGEEGEEMTHLCDTCKYREEECKFSRIVFNGETGELTGFKCAGDRKDKNCE